MRTIGTGLFMCGVAIVLPAVATAATVDFEGSEGSFTSLALADGATLGAGGGSFWVTEPFLDNGGLDGFALSSHDPDDGANRNLSAFRIDFATTINTFSVNFGDYCFLNCDSDTGYLQAYDAGNNLVAWSNFALLGDEPPDYGVLSVMGSAIDHVVFWSTSNVEDGENSVYWDNMSYGVSEVPLPGTLGLLSLGLAGLGLIRRKPA